MDVRTSSALNGPSQLVTYRGRVLLIPDVIHATIVDGEYDVTFDVVFDEHGDPSLRNVCIDSRNGGPRLTAKALRDPSIALGQAMRLAIQDAATPVRTEPTTRRIHVEGWLAPDGLSETLTIRRRRASKSEQADEARRAAEVYNAARKAGVRNLQQPVMDALSCSQATASRRIEHARRLGLIEREGHQ